MMPEPLQWPQSNLTEIHQLLEITNNQASDFSLVDEIEGFFQKIYGKKCVLMPSGRSIIFNLLKLYGLNRSHTVFVTKYSSTCMYQCIGVIANLSTDFNNPHVTVINHKWGEINLEVRKSKHHLFSIEDSCDSLLINEKALFPNNAQFEIISLPKVIGSLAGGILIINKDTGIYQAMKDLQKSNLELGIKQAKLKFDFLLNGSSSEGHYYYLDEPFNTFIPKWNLLEIKSKIKSWQVIRDNLMSRHAEINQFTQNLHGDNRLGPGRVIELKDEKILSEFSNSGLFLLRSFDTNRRNDFQSNYKKIAYLPLHFGITSSHYNLALELLHKNRKYIV